MQKNKVDISEGLMIETAPSLATSKVTYSLGKEVLQVRAYVSDTMADMSGAKERILSYLKMEAYISVGSIRKEQVSDRVVQSYCYSIEISLLGGDRSDVAQHHKDPSQQGTKF